MPKKLPLCKILKPAPWQVKHVEAKKPSAPEKVRRGPGSTHPWGIEELTVAKELTKKEMTDLFWDRETSRTPKSGTSQRLADHMEEDEPED